MRSAGCWSEEVGLSVEPGVSDEQLKRADRAQLEYDAYFLALAAEKRSHPADDVMTLLTQAEDEGDKLSEQELVSMATEIIGAGSETTRNLIGSGILALPAQSGGAGPVACGPRPRTAARVEELLRYEAPVQTAVPRFVLDDVELEGVRLPDRGHDRRRHRRRQPRPQALSRQPDRLDLDRPDNQPLTFAPGIHHCLGASVARLEGQLAIGTVVRRFPAIELLRR